MHGKPPEKLKSYHDDQAEHSKGAGDAEQRHKWCTGVRRWYCESGSEDPDVVDIGGGRACRRKEQRGCTRSTEIIRMQKKEEREVVVVIWNRQVKKV
jgi:hypothetical protein